MAKVKIKPIGDRVLVRHLEEKEQVRGGIIIPDSAKEKPQEAEVIALGTGKKDENGKVQPFEVKVGDRVGSQWVIADGLTPGERVIVEGVQKVRPGLQVNPKQFVAGNK